MLLRSGASHLEAEYLAEKVAEIFNEEGHAPFPYEDCRWLKREFGSGLEELIPDLDLWFWDVFGVASRGKRLMSLNEEQVSGLRGFMSLSFFEKHPEYAWLERHVTASNTPDLFEEMLLANRLRTMLVDLFDLMLKEKFTET